MKEIIALAMNINENQKSSDSQESKIKEHLESGKTITSIEALNAFGCFRLASRISDLAHKRGMEIKRRMITLPNGKKVTQYYL
jgi:ribosomal protein L9